MRQSKNAILISVAVLLTVVFAAGIGLWNIAGRGQIVIGSKNFTESRVLSEIMAQIIERKCGLSVDRRELGSTGLCYDGLVANSLQLYPEYSGTLLTDILKQAPISDPNEALASARKTIEQQGLLRVLEPFGLNDTYVLAMHADVANARGISRISDLQKHPDLRAGFTSEFNQRPDGYPGLEKHYDLKFNEKPVDLAPGHMYGAIADKHVDVISAFSTDARIQKFRLTLLQDDRKFFPAYQAVPLIRNDFAVRHPEVLDALSNLYGKIDDATMLMLNYQVDVDGVPVKEVARRYLAALSEK